MPDVSFSTASLLALELKLFSQAKQLYPVNMRQSSGSYLLSGTHTITSQLLRHYTMAHNNSKNFAQYDI
jgi:hypothetical protein